MRALLLLLLSVVMLGRPCVCGQTTTNAAAVAPPAAPPPSYVLRPNDTVEIKVYREDDLTTTARVGADGNITFPLLGPVAVGGMNLAQAADQIRERLDRDYVVHPHVTMTVAEFAKRRFTVLGQVDKPGSYEIPSEEDITLLQAVAMAGGFTRLADAGRIHVSRVARQQAEILTVDAKHETEVAQTLAFRIRADDTITVPERLF